MSPPMDPLVLETLREEAAAAGDGPVPVHPTVIRQLLDDHDRQAAELAGSERRHVAAQREIDELGKGRDELTVALAAEMGRVGGLKTAIGTAIHVLRNAMLPAHRSSVQEGCPAVVRHAISRGFGVATMLANALKEK